MALDIICALAGNTGTYVLMDSWYANSSTFDSYREKVVI